MLKNVHNIPGQSKTQIEGQEMYIETIRVNSPTNFVATFRKSEISFISRRELDKC